MQKQKQTHSDNAKPIGNSMEIPLFRKEVIAAKTTQSAGAILLIRPVSMRLAAGLAAIMTMALSFYLAYGEYTRKVVIAGQIVPSAGAIKVVSPQFGRIDERKVHEGDVVIKGQVLYDLTAERSNINGGIESRIDVSLASRRALLIEEQFLQDQQLKQREKSLKIRQNLIAAEMERTEQELLLQTNHILNAEKILKRYMTLRQQGFVSELQFSQIENDHNEQLARRLTLERSSLASNRDLLQAQVDARETNSQIHLNETQTARNIATLDQEVAEHQGRSGNQILAPAAGVVTALAFYPGQSVPAGVTLATIIPEGSTLEAHLLAPSRSIGFIEANQNVSLRLAAFPYQKFGLTKGKVVRVERSPINDASETGVSAGGALKEPVYRIIVQMKQQSVMAHGKELPFRAGMTLEADIRQERRRLIEWIIDPIVSVAKNHAE
ncbi:MULTISPECIES: HlyD family efflux transporter periplasmic adaptor subunit [unclassified Janthinobacterium]|uniref:HlyD family efflux transporter periplasmic adaptor subunit n=1 Tax=unclassified Janthinobacterium TaxID=2610881 RepID=UPI000347D3F5|nr:MULTISPECIES: HlyD family efflux transporter periplasmic adaptor subunit [unclassified Janthinobacterium]MEC5162480.1 membrane fusion protein [Janthinobacterium sp. CG_S6]